MGHFLGVLQSVAFLGNLEWLVLFMRRAVLRASVDEEDREEEKEDGYAAHGGDEDDSGGWRGESRPENQSGSRDTRVAFRRAVRRSQTHRLPKRELPRQSWSHHRLGEFL